ncbi:MAG: DMT family transporter, partial [Paracoccus sp. (in: a-proteobacteria)]
QIIWATIYGWYIFDEVLDGPTMIGAGVIIASGLYIVWRESARRGDTNQPVIEARLRADTVTTPKSSVLQRILSGRGNSRQ